MDEMTFESSLSMEEIEKNFKNMDFFSGLMEGLREALAYTRDEIPDSTLIHVVEVQR